MNLGNTLSLVGGPEFVVDNSKYQSVKGGKAESAFLVWVRELFGSVVGLCTHMFLLSSLRTPQNVLCSLPNTDPRGTCSMFGMAGAVSPFARPAAASCAGVFFSVV